VRIGILFALAFFALALGCITEQPASVSNIYNTSNGSQQAANGSGSAKNATNLTGDWTSIVNITDSTNASAESTANATNASDADLTNAAKPCEANLTIYYFYSDYCPYSAATNPFIDDTEASYAGRLCIARFETGKDRDNLRLFYDLAEKANFPEALQGVPTIFINGTYLTGAADIRQNLGRSIDACLLAQDCAGPAG
jgi:thiol-disulfide isomerase/thioredoxin